MNEVSCNPVGSLTLPSAMWRGIVRLLILFAVLFLFSAAVRV
jgi:hypothetical protein